MVGTGAPILPSGRWTWRSTASEISLRTQLFASPALARILQDTLTPRRNYVILNKRETAVNRLTGRSRSAKHQHRSSIAAYQR